jgi:hypothetical protein
MAQAKKKTTEERAPLNSTFLSGQLQFRHILPMNNVGHLFVSL